MELSHPLPLTLSAGYKVNLLSRLEITFEYTDRVNHMKEQQEMKFNDASPVCVFNVLLLHLSYRALHLIFYKNTSGLTTLNADLKVFPKILKDS